jgi:hypothetical protein
MSSGRGPRRGRRQTLAAVVACLGFTASPVVDHRRLHGRVRRWTYIHTRRREIHKLGICGSAPFYTSRGSPPFPPSPPSPPPPQILPERRANTNDKTVWSNIQRCFSSLVTIHRGNKWQKNNRSRETQTFPAWISSKQTDRYLSPALGPCSEVNATMGYAPAIP